ncbi:MAG: GAF domain-containing protein, partial [Anaerolineales bacterium]|nr:GAF domain-containing protein [Anaerolineales bacterium]
SVAGGYAYAPEAPPRFKVGEGIVGQAAASRRPLFLNDLAESDITIISGLGSKKPTHLSVFPLLYEDVVVGVIELGRWSAFSKIEQQFISQVVESIAIAFNTARVRMQIDALLTKTQQQAAELQAQEEELRATNEALAVKAAELRAKHAAAQDKTAVHK